MVLVFGHHVELDDEGDYRCRLCSKWFYSTKAIYSHCRNTTRHEWCEPCERVFVTEADKAQHLTDSPNHHICFICNNEPDFDDEDELDLHLEECHFWCSECNSCHDSEDELHEHIVLEHFGCDICLARFGNENSLRHHKKTHENKAIECPRCDRVFARFSFLLLHLERSSCSSVDTLKEIAFFARESYDFTTNFSSKAPWLCAECQKAFVCLSGLYQHVEDTEDCCSYLLTTGDSLDSLIKYIISELEDY